MHRGTPKDTAHTRVGNNGYFMAYSHVAHDCQVGDGVIMANGASLAGHVIVEDKVNMAAFAAVHQFCRIGCHSMLAAGSIVIRDVPPYMLASGDRAQLRGLNARGLQRSGFPRESIQALKQAYRILYRSGEGLQEALQRVRESVAQTDEVRHLLEFLKNSSNRGVTR